MSPQKISQGTIHKMPEDLQKTLSSDKAMLKAWEDISPLARNEWICWITSPVQDKTRAHRLKRTKSELKEGKRRPCCWIGCIHRTDKAISPSVQGILNRKSKN